MLYAEDVPLTQLADEFGTPLFAYSRNAIIRNFVSYERAFRPVPHLVCFALKANSSGAILRTLAELGCGADVVSGGELYRAVRSGIPAQRIVYAGVGKTASEIGEAIRRKILVLNVESEQELLLIDEIAEALRRVACVGLRVNPDIDPQTHPYISTGLRRHKFGIPMQKAIGLYRLAARMKNIRIVGIHMHLGSQIQEPAPFREALERVLSLVDELSSRGIHIRYLDMGGGAGIPYVPAGKAVTPRALAKAILPLLRGRKLQLILEPGRSIVGDAGILLTRVLYCKKSGRREFVVTDAGMNDLIRPSLYNAHHEVQPVVRRNCETMIADIVGPVCETADFLAKSRRIERVQPGDLLAVMNAGAYGLSMSSNYNSRPRAAEVMVDGDRCSLIRKRETFRDLVRGET
jgi:diaminopimelate decarboxylase